METVVLCLVLVLARTAAFVMAMPVLGGPNVPRLVKAGLAVALAVAWFDGVLGQMPVEELFRSSPLRSSWLGLGLALGREVILGALLGYAFGLFLVPARVAGEFLSQETGLGAGNQLDPVGGPPGGALPQLFELIGILILFGLNGHHLFLATAYGTFAQYPVGAALPEMPAARMVTGLARAQEWGLVLAMPVAVYLFLTTVLLALLSRAAPQLNLYSVGFPLRLIVGLAATLLLLPNVTGGMVNAYSHLARLLLGPG